MSKEALEGFYEKVKTESTLKAKLETAASEEAFVKLVVELGAQNGLSFTADEVRARLKAEAGAAPSGKLSDGQLESVAGGVAVGNRVQLLRYCGYTVSKAGR